MRLGAWGAVCSDSRFGIAEMTVACRNMGFLERGILNAVCFIKRNISLFMCGMHNRKLR